MACNMRYVVMQLVEVPHYKVEGCKFDSYRGHWELECYSLDHSA